LLLISLIENVPETVQKEQPNNIKQRQEVTVTVKEPNQEVIFENAGSRSFNLI